MSPAFTERQHQGFRFQYKMMYFFSHDGRYDNGAPMFSQFKCFGYDLDACLADFLRLHDTPEYIHAFVGLWSRNAVLKREIVRLVDVVITGDEIRDAMGNIPREEFARIHDRIMNRIPSGKRTAEELDPYRKRIKKNIRDIYSKYGTPLIRMAPKIDIRGQRRLQAVVRNKDVETFFRFKKDQPQEYFNWHGRKLALKSIDLGEDKISLEFKKEQKMLEENRKGDRSRPIKYFFTSQSPPN